MKTITVKGVGTASVKPDTVELKFTLEKEHRDYEKAMELSERSLKNLIEALVEAGFSHDDLKTTSFSADIEQDNIRDENGYHLRYVFRAYSVTQRLVLRFPFEKEMLSRALTAVAKSKSAPEFSINFTVSDPAQVQDEILASASENACRKARVLAQSSGAALGELLRIDYNWGEIEVYSRTDVKLSNLAYGDCDANDCFAPEITPDDIESEDTATFTWSLA